MHVVHSQAGTSMMYMCSRTSGPSPARDLAAYLTEDSRLSTVILERLLRVELSRGVKARMYSKCGRSTINSKEVVHSNTSPQ
jgi:hypothetical protein